MRILLTGGSGMLGSAIQKELNSLGYEFSAPSSAELDLLSSTSTSEFVTAFQPNSIIHAAARVGGIQANINDPYRFLTENIVMDSNLFKIAKELRIQNLVYIGSTCMYPKDKLEVLSELDLLTGPLEPTNEGYALSKIVGLKTVEIVSKQFGLNWRTFVPSNLYGPGDHFEIGRSHLLAAIINKVWEAKESGSTEVEMWGDGTSRREFTYVNDVANFIVHSLKGLHSLPQYLNLGAGVDHSILEYYETVCELMSFKGKITTNLSMPTGMKCKLSSIELAREFGWEPKTSLEDGIVETLSWFMAQKGVSKNV
jgi:GDP-L-fucose synthase